MKKNFLLFFSFFSFFLCAENKKKSIYSTIQPINLASIEWQEEDWPNEPFYDYLQRVLEYQEHMQEFKKRRIVFRKFHELSADQAPCQNVLRDIKTVEDLNIFCGQKACAPYVAQLLDRTLSSPGKIFLYGLIGCPVNNIPLLEQRQKIVRYFLEHEGLRSQVRDVFTTCIAPSENMLLSFWGQDGFYNASGRHYFSMSYCQSVNDLLNKSQTVLLARSFLEHQRRAVALVAAVAASVILPVYGVSLMLSEPVPEWFRSAARGLQGSGDRVLGLLSQVGNKVVACSALIAGGFYTGLACKEEFHWAYDNYVIDECVQKKMMRVAQFVQGLRRIHGMCTHHPELVEYVPGLQKIVEFFESTAAHNQDLKKLLEILETSTFKGDASFASHHGRILVAYRLMTDLKEEFAPLLLAIGELDAYTSVAMLMDEHECKRVRYCFARYIQNTTPIITLNKFWNPFINAQKVITNDVFLGGDNKKNMIITGPNAGGKSTLIKAIAVNIILAQSLGIAAAVDMELTPFDVVGTYLNVVDDIAGGNSLFKAQVLRAQEMLDMVKNTPKNFFSFVAVDEMFNGTSAQESKAAAYSVAKHIGTFDNNMCVVATHFPLLTSLATEHSVFENYKVTVQVDADGSIHYPFKLERGVSSQHIALDILRQEGYSGEIVSEAAKMLEQCEC